MRVEIDTGLCSGYGNCVIAAPGVFDLDADRNLAVVRPGRPAPGDADALADAEADCPAHAIRLEHR